MSPVVERTVLAGSAPALLVFAESAATAAARGVILFFHGLSASKETGMKELDSLARAGYLAVALDNVGHGGRRFDDFDHRFSSHNPQLERDFTHAVDATAAEVPQVVDDLLERYPAGEGRLGVAGISMGGFITYRAVVVEPRLTVAVSILGSPEWKTDSPNSPHLHRESFFPRALLSQNAGNDQSVPPEAARRLHEGLLDAYTSAPERQRFVEFPGVGHFMPEDDWNLLWQNVLDWFHRFL